MEVVNAMSRLSRWWRSLGTGCLLRWCDLIIVIAFHGDLIIAVRKNLSQKGHIQLCIENFDNDILDIKLEGKFSGFQIADGCMIA